MVARYYYKKIPVDDHIYDLPDFIELPPLPPPRPTLVPENESISEASPSVSELSARMVESNSLHDAQQPAHGGVPPGHGITATTDDFPEENSGDVLTGTNFESDLPHLKPICSCHEEDNSILDDTVIPNFQMQENDAYGLVPSDIQGSQELPQPHSPLSLTSNGRCHDSELNSNYRGYEQVCGYERIQTCDAEIEHLLLQCKGTQDHNPLKHPHTENESLTAMCRQPQSLSGDENQAPTESSSYERIWGYETVQHCDLHLESLLHPHERNESHHSTESSSKL